MTLGGSTLMLLLFTSSFFLVLFCFAATIILSIWNVCTIDRPVLDVYVKRMIQFYSISKFSPVWLLCVCVCAFISSCCCCFFNVWLLVSIQSLCTVVLFHIHVHSHSILLISNTFTVLTFSSSAQITASHTHINTHSHVYKAITNVFTTFNAIIVSSIYCCS